MEWTYSMLAWFSLLLAAALLLLLNGKKWRIVNKQRPPGPTGWPVLGNIFEMGSMPHQDLCKLRTKYGPVVWLKLGCMNTMVVQSAKAAAELFKNHDMPFCDRKCPAALFVHNYNQGSLAFGRYGVYWRILRRLCTMELLVNKRINESVHLRRKCMDNMLQSIEEEARTARSRGESGEVDLPRFLFLMSFNVIGNLVLSRDLLDSQSKEGYEFFEAMNKWMEMAGTPNLVDFLPFLKWLDPQGINRKMVHVMGRVMRIVGGFVNERIEDQNLGKMNANKDFLNALLEYEGNGKEGPDKISGQNMNIIVLEMFLAGSETTSNTIEWAMAELMHNPDFMKKAKEELKRVIGQCRKVEETDIDELPYLQAVVKETLRLHPPVPLMVPRNALEDTNYMGYQIPKDTQILVNAWAIGRDPDAWEDPLSFKPERFVGSNIDYKGQNYELLPFGSGRRICVGISLAHRVVHLGIASLLHCFDWELDNNVAPETMDMNERMGLTVRKFVPLKAIPKKCIIDNQ